jgi:GST-like protein
VASYTHVQRWTQEIHERPAVKRGRRVNRVWGEEEYQLAERHDASDLD